jgi:hypothetical protein
MAVLTGGCQCGAVRYRFEGTPGHSGICHCRMCQKASGNFGLGLVSLPVAGFTWTRGKPSEFRSSPPVARGFCKACGTPLYMHDDDDTNYEITLGSLDDPNAAPPTTQVGTESKVAWFATLEKLPAKRTDEAVTPEMLARYKSLQHPDHD